MKFQRPESHIHLIARGFLARKKEIILCRAKNTKHFFLPGGHIEDGESARTALLRELREETGVNGYKITYFLGVCENIFSPEVGIFQHEINIMFKVDITNKEQISSREDHIEFVSVSVNKLKSYKILPVALKEGLIEWLKDGKPFFKGI